MEYTERNQYFNGSDTKFSQSKDYSSPGTSLVVHYLGCVSTGGGIGVGEIRSHTWKKQEEEQPYQETFCPQYPPAFTDHSSSGQHLLSKGNCFFLEGGDKFIWL